MRISDWSSDVCSSDLFARDARASGFHGDIYSFEPLAVAHAICSAAARSDPRWTVLPAMALGAETGTATINVSENLASSSLLDVEAQSVEALRETGYTGTEEIVEIGRASCRERGCQYG